MRYWTSLVAKFGFGRRARGAEAEYALALAYREVFSGKPSSDDQQIVLADLMAKSGFNAVTPSSASNEELRMQEGKRELFANVFAYLNLSPEDMQALGNAARRELVMNNTQEQGIL